MHRKAYGTRTGLLPYKTRATHTGGEDGGRRKCVRITSAGRGLVVTACANLRLFWQS